jgi:hypothetical protein
MPDQYEVKAYFSLTIGATPVSLANASIPAGGVDISSPARVPDLVVGYLEAGSIRVRMDGTAPTESEGMLVQQDTVITLEGPDEVRAFRAVRAQAVDAVLRGHAYTFKGFRTG